MTDGDGWVNVEEELPDESLFYKLVWIMDRWGKTQVGWWTGCGWDCGRWSISRPVIRWKPGAEAREKYLRH